MKWTGVIACALTCSVAPAQGVGTELVTNGGFETGNLFGWTNVTGTSQVSLYGGTPNDPPFSVSLNIVGGVYLFGATTSNLATIEQVIDVTGAASQIDANNRTAVVRVHLGGSGADNDDARLLVEFLNVSNAVLDSVLLGPVTNINRVNETNLLEVNSKKTVPSGTRKFRLRATLTKNSGFSSDPNFARVDNVRVELGIPQATAPQPLNTELLVNGNLETGVSGQPKDGWIVDQGPVKTFFYGTPSPQIPTFAYGQSISGGLYLAAAGSNPTLSTMYQVIDVSGNAAAVDSNQLEIVGSAFLGGETADPDDAGFTVDFIGPQGQVLDSKTAGPVSEVGRGYKTRLMKREFVTGVPPLTRALRCTLALRKLTGFSSDFGLATADNMSVRMRTKVAPAALPYGTQLVVNGEFESAQVPEVAAATGWQHTAGLIEVDSYGAVNAPSFAVSAGIGGGSQFARGLVGGANVNSITQRFGLTGNAANIDAGVVMLDLSAALGGVSTDNDDARWIGRFRSAAGQILGEVVVGPVTPTDRGNQTTLLMRSGSYVVPPLTRDLELELRITKNSGFTSDFANGLADRMSAVLCLMPGCGTAKYPGTGEDFVLRSGVGTAAATTGPGLDVKIVSSGSQVVLQTISPNGKFVGGLPILGVQLFTTGIPPVPTMPTVHFNLAQAVLLLNSNFSTPFNQFLPPGGISLYLVIPPGLVGSSVLAQPVVISTAANNGVFASADAHELKIQ